MWGCRARTEVEAAGLHLRVPYRRDGHGSSFHRITDDHVRTRGDSGETVFGHRGEQADPLQPAAQDLRFAPEAAVHLRARGSAGRTRRNGQGLRVRQGPVRDVLERGTQSARGSRHRCRRHHRVRADLGRRSGLFRQGLLPGAGQGRRETVRAVRQGAEGFQALRARPLGGARQAVHRDAASGRGWPGHAATAVRRRSALDQGDRYPAHGRQAGRAQARAAIDRGAVFRPLRSDRIQGRRQRAHRKGRAEEGRGRGSHAGRAGRPRRRRAGHRPDGSAAREPCAQGRQAIEGQRSRGEARDDAQAGEDCQRSAGRSRAAHEGQERIAPFLNSCPRARVLPPDSRGLP